MPLRTFSRRSPADGYRVGIVNPLTLVAKELKAILAERSFPYARIDLIDTTGTETGTLTEVDGAASVVVAASDESFAELDLVFFTGPAERNEPWIGRYRDEEFIAIDLSQVPALAGEGRAVVAGVNDDQLNDDDGLIVSPQAFVVPVILILAALARKFAIGTAAATVTRPASEFDQAGIDELFQQTLNVLNLKSFPTTIFDRQAAFTMYPPEDGVAAERAAGAQLRAILQNVSVSLQLLQAPMFHSNGVSLFVSLDGQPTEESVREALARPASLYVVPEDEAVTTIDAAGKDEVVIGRIAQDEANPGAFWIWAAADNLRRGSALNAALVAEALVDRFAPKPN
ncbi:MAG: Asd/ArgC dimerization domain-containing protein [Thermoanaerobaculia bacterium]